MTVTEVLHNIQTQLKVGKSNENTFGKYKYRTCSDILEAVKPLLPAGFCVLLTDDLVLIGERYYVKAKAELTEGANGVCATAFARESFDKKGMDDSQITGTASSYARKYALNALFAIDDTVDADGVDNRDHSSKKDADEKAKRDYDALCDAHMESLVCIRNALAESDYSTAKEAWNELDEATKMALWKAPTKGGWFNTEERNKMKSTEFRTANGGSNE
jgi:hypothetical protein